MFKLRETQKEEGGAQKQTSPKDTKLFHSPSDIYGLTISAWSLEVEW